MTNDELLDAARILRPEAVNAGPDSPLWDVIFDAESLGVGRTPLHMRDVVEQQINDALRDVAKHKLARMGRGF